MKTLLGVSEFLKCWKTLCDTALAQDSLQKMEWHFVYVEFICKYSEDQVFWFTISHYIISTATLFIFPNFLEIKVLILAIVFL